jgi:DNA-binding response OmpR family regulator
MIERGWILIVEDNPGVADVLIGLFEERGFDCQWASCDIDAQDAIASRPPPAALLLDVNLGAGTTGFDLARFCRRRHPDVPIIFASGEVTHGSFKAFGVPNSCFLPKPFSHEEFELALRDAFPDATV